MGLNKQRLVVYAGSAFVWLMFFWVGVYLSKRERDYQIGWLILGLVISFISMFFETQYLYVKTGLGVGIKPSSFVFSFLSILVLFSKKIEGVYRDNFFINKALRIIGNYSFSIYLIHCYVISLLFHWFDCSLWIVRWMMVVCITMLIIYIARKMLPIKLQSIIGFDK